MSVRPAINCLRTSTTIPGGKTIRDDLDIAVVGAGPYGLSIAAHLGRLNASYRVFGKPMDTWLNHMPKGMFLKSDAFASCLSAPAEMQASCDDGSLRSYCARHAIPYHDLDIPVALKTFVDYALDFRRQFVPVVDERSVTDVRARDGGGFELKLDDGETIGARRIVLAIGISHFDYVPDMLAALPTELASHSSAHHNLEHFKDRDVTIVGAGSSAIDMSALLHEAGAKVRMVVRKPDIRIYPKPDPGERSLWQRIQRPQTGLGPGWRSRMACDAPDVFRYLPASLRLEIVRRHLGPAAAWYLGPRVLGRFPILRSHTVSDAKAHNGGVQLTLQPVQGTAVKVDTDHVIAATGYRVDVDRLSFISEDIRSRIQKAGKTPVLTRNFESSVPGLYFVGIAAAGSFGPLMRFVYGCEFATRRVVRHVTR
jgi:Pyridine nucleotide-disulphide oxidoreductase